MTFHSIIDVFGWTVAFGFLYFILAVAAAMMMMPRYGDEAFQIAVRIWAYVVVITFLLSLFTFLGESSQAYKGTSPIKPAVIQKLT